EMFEQFQADPQSVSESWREFFEYFHRPGGNGAGAAAPARAEATARPPAEPGTAAAAPPSGPAAEPPGEPLRGAAARIVANMEASLEVPTATSFRDVPAKLLEVNRKVINGYLTRKGRGKVSFTHIIGYAVVRAIADSMPAMNATFVEDAEGNPRL